MVRLAQADLLDVGVRRVVARGIRSSWVRIQSRISISVRYITQYNTCFNRPIHSLLTWLRSGLASILSPRFLPSTSMEKTMRWRMRSFVCGVNAVLLPCPVPSFPQLREPDPSGATGNAGTAAGASEVPAVVCLRKRRCRGRKRRGELLNKRALDGWSRGGCPRRRGCAYTEPLAPGGEWSPWRPGLDPTFSRARGRDLVPASFCRLGRDTKRNKRAVGRWPCPARAVDDEAGR